MSRLAGATAGTILVASAVGLLDAARGGVWDLFVLFLAIAAVQCVSLFVSFTGRAQVTVRPDLARSISERADANGEPVPDAIDRALAFYQHGLYPAETDDGR